MRNNYTKSVNMNVQRTRFLNFWAYNNPREVDKPLRSINDHYPVSVLLFFSAAFVKAHQC